jgi:uncharacterized HAD superfamily protein
MRAFPSEIKRVLLVDDVVLTGGSLEKAKQQLAICGLEKIVTCCPFVTAGFESKVDFGGALVSAPSLYEWNFVGHNIVERACVDFDGIICYDPTRSQDDDGGKYLAFLQSAQARYKFNSKIGSIVTSRLNKYRPETERWLSANGVAYDNLFMLDAPDLTFRSRHEMSAAFKAKIYKETNAVTFFESEHWQARLIANASGMSVVCTDIMKLVVPQPDIASPFWLRKLAKKAARYAKIK